MKTSVVDGVTASVSYTSSDTHVHGDFIEARIESSRKVLGVLDFI